MPEEITLERAMGQNFIMKKLIHYLLFERKQETELAMAFATLVQERHAEFHDIHGRDSDQQSNFADCKNEKCQMAYKILQSQRSPSVEINDFSIDMVNEYNCLISVQAGFARAWLEPKETSKLERVTPPGIVIPNGVSLE